GEKAASAETSVKPVPPISSRRRRPRRSLREPIGTSSPASTSGYTSTIHSSCWPVGASASESTGRAKERTVLSTETSSTGTISTASAAQEPRAAGRIGEGFTVGCTATSGVVGAARAGGRELRHTKPSRRYSPWVSERRHQ